MMLEVAGGVVIGGITLYIIFGTVELIATNGEPDSASGKIAKVFWYVVAALIAGAAFLIIKDH
jgi:hypothetical protein